MKGEEGGKKQWRNDEEGDFGLKNSKPPLSDVLMDHGWMNKKGQRENEISFTKTRADKVLFRR
jgi:hypothetical protein